MSEKPELPEEVERELEKEERHSFSLDESPRVPLGWTTDQPLPDTLRFKDLRRVIATALQCARVDGSDGVYDERDRLVAAISKLFPSRLERHPDSDVTWDDEWRWIVFIDLPTGQASWHIHDRELPWFKHLTRSCSKSWDGHTTEEKYQRLERLAEER